MEHSDDAPTGLPPDQEDEEGPLGVQDSEPYGEGDPVRAPADRDGGVALRVSDFFLVAVAIGTVNGERGTGNEKRGTVGDERRGVRRIQRTARPDGSPLTVHVVFTNEVLPPDPPAS